MSLTGQLLERLTDATLTINERARVRCQLAKEMEESGDHEGAYQAMGELWKGIGQRSHLKELDKATQAEVLLRVGVLSGWLGSIKQIPDAQEQAQNLISESIHIFEELQAAEKVDEALTEQARCYWRQGAFDNARSLLQTVLERLANSENDTKLVAVVRSATVEWTSKRYHDALRIHTKYAPLFGESTNNALRGKFHNGFAVVLGILGTAEKREDYIDRALIEYAAASYHFEQAGHIGYCAVAENNLALLYLSLNKYVEAHEHLDRAQQVLVGLKDSVHLAQVADSRAKVLLAEGQNEEAQNVAGWAVQTLEQGDQLALLAEALITYGVALARTGHHVRARQTLQRAMAIAEQASDLEAAGRAALAIIEELSAHVAIGELASLYINADDLLANAQEPGIPGRLRAAARTVIRLWQPQTGVGADVTADWQGFSLRKAIHGYERRMIELALKDADGMVSRAAKLLGFKYHQSLISLLNNRHQDLLPARLPVVPRKRSYSRRRRAKARPRRPAKTEQQARPVTILHAEDNRIVAEAVSESLALEGWRVETCEDGAAALDVIRSNAAFDLLLIDYDLPRVDGLELLRRARQLAHRAETPMIMLSASDVAAEARAAGANVFLRKPQDILKLAGTITKLLGVQKQG
ncbi:MAG TPA: response regulator [Pyrinomonadaceae bacterium]